MIGLLARCMFEATRVSPLANAATGRDWRSSSDHLAKNERVTQRKDRTTMPMDKNQRKLEQFARLHHSDGAFLMPNAWDAGTARILEGLGFEALATTSAGLAFSMGIRDSSVSLRRRPSDLGIGPMVSPTLCPTLSTALKSKFFPQPMVIADGIGQMMINCALWRKASSASVR